MRHVPRPARLAPPAAALLLVLVLALAPADGVAVPPSPLRPVTTYSIVARDLETGELGVAVQSHWFSVGALVPWAEAGVGAVATQSMVDPSYGPRGLALMNTAVTSFAVEVSPTFVFGQVPSDMTSPVSCAVPFVSRVARSPSV